MGVLSKAKHLFSLFVFKKKWRILNKHNETTVKTVFPINLVKVGKFTYGSIEVHTWSADNEFLQIGNYVSIAEGVKFLLGGNHYYKSFSTFPFKVKYMGNQNEAFSKGKIIVGDDVWLGTDALILSGVKIGQGSIIGAGSVISKDVPPYSIVVGNPAQIIKYRFKHTTIDKLLQIDFSKIDEEFIRNNIVDLYKDLDDKTLENLLEKYNDRVLKRMKKI